MVSSGILVVSYMKDQMSFRLLMVASILTFVSCSCRSQNVAIPDRELAVRILCSPDLETFPRSGVNTQPTYAAEALPVAEVDRCTRIVQVEIKKYPASLLESRLRRVYLLSSVRCRDTEIGGVNFGQTRTIVLDSGPGVTDTYLARLFDHEMIHLLTTGGTVRFPYRDWIKVNAPSFRYGNGGLESIKAGLTSGDGDEECRLEGFSRPYGKSDIWEDVACIGEMLFTGDPTFWDSVDRSELLREKVNILASYLHTLHDAFSLELFRLMPASVFVAGSSRFELGELLYFPDGGKIVAPAEPLRLIPVPEGGAALFPARSGVKQDSRPTTEAPASEYDAPSGPVPSAPDGYGIKASKELGGWLIYVRGRGLLHSSKEDRDRFQYRNGDTILLPFGGFVYAGTGGNPLRVKPGTTITYSAPSVVVFNPRPHQV